MHGCADRRLCPACWPPRCSVAGSAKYAAFSATSSAAGSFQQRGNGQRRWGRLLLLRNAGHQLLPAGLPVAPGGCCVLAAQPALQDPCARAVHGSQCGAVKNDRPRLTGLLVQLLRQLAQALRRPTTRQRPLTGSALLDRSLRRVGCNVCKVWNGFHTLVRGDSSTVAGGRFEAAIALIWHGPVASAVC